MHYKVFMGAKRSLSNNVFWQTCSTGKSCQARHWSSRRVRENQGSFEGNALHGTLTWCDIIKVLSSGLYPRGRSSVKHTGCPQKSPLRKYISASELHIFNFRVSTPHKKVLIFEDPLLWRKIKYDYLWCRVCHIPKIICWESIKYLPLEQFFKTFPTLWLV